MENLTYREAMVPNIMPKSLLVVGSGAIGIEFACFTTPLVLTSPWSRFWRVLPVEDTEISEFARKDRKTGMTILTPHCSGLDKGANTVTASVDQDGTTRKSQDRVILAVGLLQCCTLGLEDTKVDVNAPT